MQHCKRLSILVSPLPLDQAEPPMPTYSFTYWNSATLTHNRPTAMTELGIQRDKKKTVSHSVLLRRYRMALRTTRQRGGGGEMGNRRSRRMFVEERNYKCISLFLFSGRSNGSKTLDVAQLKLSCFWPTDSGLLLNLLKRLLWLLWIISQIWPGLRWVYVYGLLH